ncbi:MAG: hypothetical protein AAGI71_18225 [Bacteroidota bacterium]
MHTSPTPGFHVSSFLSAHRLPTPRFLQARTPAVLRPLWRALDDQDEEQATYLIGTVLDQSPLSDDLMAAVHAAQATVALMRGDLPRVEVAARQSLDLVPCQWLAQRLILSAFESQHRFDLAQGHFETLKIAYDLPAWDTPLERHGQLMAMATWAWHLKQWDAVAGYLVYAYPKGVIDMPLELCEDWFRLSLYRQEPAEAGAAAARLIPKMATPHADELLQTIVRRGWYAEALPLYRKVYRREPESELLRRRLIALCIREGVIEEARQLSRLGALKSLS